MAHEPKEYIFTGSLSLSGVTFFITASDEDEARAKAKAGDCDDWDYGGAASTAWEIDPDSLELNE